MTKFGRLLTAMVTPFNDDYSVNYQASAELAKRLVENGSDGLVVAGSTGEAATMTQTEKLKLFASVLDAVGDKAAVIAGTGSNDTKATIEFTREAAKVGVHGALLVGPYYNKPPQEGFYQHFKAIAEAIDLPMLVYNVPGRTGTNILPATIERLAALKNIVGVKESSGNLEQIAEVVRCTSKDFLVYSGDDALALPTFAVGGSGLISVAAHVAGKELKEMITAFFSGNMEKAQALHLSLLPLFKAMFITANPIPVKKAVALTGLNAGPVRLPLVNATKEETEKIQKALLDAGIKLA
ncbi:MAG: 4-hydroxy-tetrahydrodipicolinate synthase [Pelosinus sp.]|nr:4-hydroxy-tetrahydrodipicolinate synthase [Pelosinus sp.]